MPWIEYDYIGTYLRTDMYIVICIASLGPGRVSSQPFVPGLVRYTMWIRLCGRPGMVAFAMNNSCDHRFSSDFRFGSKLCSMAPIALMAPMAPMASMDPHPWNGNEPKSIYIVIWMGMMLIKIYSLFFPPQLRWDNSLHLYALDNGGRKSSASSSCLIMTSEPCRQFDPRENHCILL